MKTILFITLLFFATKLQAQQCGAGNYSNIALGFTSTEITSLTGSFTLQFKVFTSDTAYLDSLSFTHLPNGFNASNSASYNKTVLYVGDSALVTTSVNYPVNNLPYYPDQIDVTVHSHSAQGARNTKATQVVVFFTPYNTIELWNKYDYLNLPRQWNQPTTGVAPTRVYISKDSLPVSTRLPNTDTTKTVYEIENEYVVQLPNMPYGIVMKARTPAQLQALMDQDSVNYTNNTTSQKSSAALAKNNYQGTIQGYVTFNKTSDYDNFYNLYPPLSGVHIQLVWIQYGIKHVKAGGIIDADGNYSLSYNFDVRKIFNQGKLILRLVSDDNGDFDIVVKPSQTNNILYNLHATVFSAMGVQNNGLKTGVDWNISYVDKAPFVTLHYIHNAYKFVRKHYSSVDMPNGITVNVYINSNVFGQSSHYDPVLHPAFGYRIYLETDDTHRKTVVYHEFGHHVMNRLQGGYPHTGAVANHPWQDEKTPREVWTEGWGYAFAQMCDLEYWQEDNEFDWAKSIPGAGHYTKDAPLELRNPKVFSLEPNNQVNNGFRSEYNIACALFDLYDGADKIPSWKPTTDYNDNDLNYPHKYDTDLLQINTRAKSSYAKGTDYVSLSFKQIADFFIAVKNGTLPLDLERQNIYEYYNWLINTTPTGCDRDDIATVFRENRVTYDVSDANYEATQMKANATNNISNTTLYSFNDVSGIGYGTAHDDVYYGEYINSPCCTYDYAIDNKNFTQPNLLSYQAYHNVNVATVAPVVCQPASHVEFVAGSNVKLGAGFSAKAGSTVAMRINNCGSAYSGHRLAQPSVSTTTGITTANTATKGGAPSPTTTTAKPFSPAHIHTYDQLDVYPNPTNGTLTINNPNWDTYTYTLQSLHSALLKQGHVTNNQLSIAEYPTGMYLLQLTNAEGVSTTFKVVKE